MGRIDFTRHQKLNISSFLEFLGSRIEPQNLPFCPPAPQHNFSFFVSILSNQVLKHINTIRQLVQELLLTTSWCLNIFQPQQLPILIFFQAQPLLISILSSTTFVDLDISISNIFHLNLFQQPELSLSYNFSTTTTTNQQSFRLHPMAHFPFASWSPPTCSGASG